MRKSIIFLFSIVVFFSGCAATQIPMTMKLNDYLMMDTETNNKETVDVLFTSNVQDGIYQACQKDSKTPYPNSGSPGMVITEKTTFEQMLNEYLSMKFSNQAKDSGIKIDILLKDFWVNSYTDDSSAKQALVFMGGGEINYTFVANVELNVKITKDGQAFEKIIKASGDSAYVYGVSTGTSTSNIYKGHQSSENMISAAVNAANNKAIMMLNKYLEANQL